MPPHGFEPGRAAYVAPPADGSAVELAIDPASERLHALAPWPAWDGRDFVELPVLVKTQGKTTTDHISPAGPWLRYRGHLDRFSDNLLSGARNAFTGEVGEANGQPLAATRARLPRARPALGRSSATRTTAKAAAASTRRCRRGCSAAPR